MSRFSENVDLSLNFKNLKRIDQRKSGYQDANIYIHPLLGKILILNKEVHHVEKWAPLYHEMVVHLPVASIPTVKNVLILGGGSLFAAEEILKYKSVNYVLLIDHDYTVIDIIEKNYKHAKKVLNDRRFKLLIDDAFSYISSNDKKFDLIVNDSIDLVEMGKKRHSNLLDKLCNNLTSVGVCSDVVYRNIFERKTTQKTINMLKSKYNSSFSLITVPEYPGIFHILCLWSKNNKYITIKKIYNKLQKEWINIQDQSNLSFKFYNPKFIDFYKYLPPYLNEVLNKQIS